MSSREKRASLSSGLLTSKDVAPSADPRPVPADDAESAVETTPLTPPAVLPATMLSRKGAASAAGFRPEYWSYDRTPADRAPAPPPAPSPAVVPLFAEAPPRLAEPPPTPAETVAGPTAAAASAMEEQTRPSVLILGLGCMAVILSTSLYWLSNSGHGDRGELPAVSLPAARIAAAHPSEPAAPVAAVKPAAPATPEIPVAVASPGEASAVVPPRVEAPTVAPAPAKAPPAATLSPDEIENLVARGGQLLATGDIVAARLYFQRAAEQGSGAAATGVGQTYDPLFLEQSHVRGVRGDAALAAEWYRKAIAAGDRQGQIRLDHLTQRYPG